MECSRNNLQIDCLPTLIRDGVYGATFNKNGESLYLRMETITEENEKYWFRFRQMTTWLANDNNGALSVLVIWAGQDKYPEYEEIIDITGFTREEYLKFTEKAIHVKKTSNKIVNLLKNSSAGSNHMSTGFFSGEQRYIAYVTKNPHFTIQNKGIVKEFNIRNYIDNYSDILISVGSNFSNNSYFYNRGIARNPWWVFEEKYSGLAMLLLSYTGAVAEQFFPDKEEMRVKPLGSIQWILKENLLPGEGYIERDDKKFDLTEVEVSKDDPEGPLCHIKTTALKRIFCKQIALMSKQKPSDLPKLF